MPQPLGTQRPSGTVERPAASCRDAGCKPRGPRPRCRFRTGARVAAWALALLAASAAASDRIEWERIAIDGTFRSEGVAIADVNRNGRMDVLAGDVWYEAPDWTMHEIRPAGTYVPDQGYSNCFACWAYDVNGDGWDDLIVVGFPGELVYWYENPQNEPGHWKAHLVWHSACNETPLFADLTGDGKPELILGSQPESQMGYLRIPPPERAGEKWEFVPISEPGDPGSNGTHRYYHGLGIGDVNENGRLDVVIPHGWWEAPEDPTDVPWPFHPHVLNETGEGNPLPSANIHVEDLNLNGKSDLIMSSAHDYGIWWFENVGTEEESRFQYHLIDRSFSQTHALEFADINGNGQRDLVTGKRYFAHQGNDPGGREPVVMYWYEVRREKGRPPEFIPHEIEAGRDTGVGTQFQVADFDGDGLPDIILSNKKGVNVLLQRRAAD